MAKKRKKTGKSKVQDFGNVEDKKSIFDNSLKVLF